jgi:hypothetical protein
MMVGRRKWGAFVSKLFLSLLVVGSVASVVLWFFYPTIIFEIWEWSAIVVIGLLELLFIVSLLFLYVADLLVNDIVSGWFRKVFSLPKKYVVWLTKDLHSDKTTVEIANQHTRDMR